MEQEHGVQEEKKEEIVVTRAQEPVIEDPAEAMVCDSCQ